MIFNNIEKSAKIEILQENILKYEKKVYTGLAELGINPDSFDESSFEVEDSSVDPIDLGTISSRQNLKKALDSLEILNNQMSLLEEWYMKFTLSSEEKKQAYQLVKAELEKALILRLSVLGIDPEEFDEESFTPAENSTAQNDIYGIICKIKDIDIKISSL